MARSLRRAYVRALAPGSPLARRLRGDDEQSGIICAHFCNQVLAPASLNIYWYKSRLLRNALCHFQWALPRRESECPICFPDLDTHGAVMDPSGSYGWQHTTSSII